MATQTPNYNLKKPANTDYYNIDDQNGNMDIIDNALTPTADPEQAPISNGPGKFEQWVSWLTNRIKAITGKANWWEAPIKTIQEIWDAHTSHLADDMPHLFTDTVAQKTYKYGLKQQDNHLVFVFEEVV